MIIYLYLDTAHYTMEQSVNNDFEKSALTITTQTPSKYTNKNNICHDTYPLVLNLTETFVKKKVAV